VRSSCAITLFQRLISDDAASSRSAMTLKFSTSRDASPMSYRDTRARALRLPAAIRRAPAATALSGTTSRRANPSATRPDASTAIEQIAPMAPTSIHSGRHGSCSRK
jgi:hypothetical protein